MFPNVSITVSITVVLQKLLKSPWLRTLVLFCLMRRGWLTWLNQNPKNHFWILVEETFPFNLEVYFQISHAWTCAQSLTVAVDYLTLLTTYSTLLASARLISSAPLHRGHWVSPQGSACHEGGGRSQKNKQGEPLPCESLVYSWLPLKLIE